MNTKKKQMILIAIALIVVLVVVGYAIYKKRADANKNTSILYDSEREEVYHKMMEEMIMPNGIFQLKSKYKGDNDLRDFYKLLKQLGDYTVTISNYSDKDIKNKYEDISNKLENEYGVTNSEELIEFYSNKKLKEIKNATIDIDTIKTNSSSMNFDITFDYNEDIKIEYSVVIQNNKYSKRFVRFTLDN